MALLSPSSTQMTSRSVLAALETEAMAGGVRVAGFMPLQKGHWRSTLFVFSHSVVCPSLN